MDDYDGLLVVMLDMFCICGSSSSSHSRRERSIYRENTASLREGSEASMRGIHATSMRGGHAEHARGERSEFGWRGGFP